MKSDGTLERVGAWASAICAVHCALTGLAIGLLSIVGLDFMASPIAEGSFLGVATLIGGVALYHGIRRHHSIVPAAIFVIGISCILLSHFAFEHATLGGTAFAVLGGAALVAFNVVNRRLQGGCDCTHCDHLDR